MVALNYIGYSLGKLGYLSNHAKLHEDDVVKDEVTIYSFTILKKF